MQMITFRGGTVMGQKTTKISIAETESGLKIELTGKSLKEVLAGCHVTESENGFKIEVTDKSLKEVLSCCVPALAGDAEISGCC